MNRIKSWFSGWRKQFKLSIYDPNNFNELFGFTTSKIRFVSLLFLVILLLSMLFTFLLIKTPLGNYFHASSKTPEQSQIVGQRLKLDSLTKKIDAQDRYINDFKRLFSGDFKSDTIKKKSVEVKINPNSINPNPTASEEKILENVKADQYTNSNKAPKNFVHFISPIKGIVSQQYEPVKHEAIDIVAPINSYFASCLSGTVIFSGFTQKDGNVIIIEHPNGFTSIYKHAKTSLKKRGDKVRTGDLIGIVGNTGSDTTGPHLHFELWLNQQSVNPSNYINFSS